MNQVLQNLAQLGVFEGTGGNVGGTGGNSAVLQQLINSMATTHDLGGSGDPRMGYGGVQQGPSFIGGGDAMRAVLAQQGLQYIAQQLQQQAESHDPGNPIKGGPHAGWGDDDTQQPKQQQGQQQDPSLAQAIQTLYQQGMLSQAIATAMTGNPSGPTVTERTGSAITWGTLGAVVGSLGGWEMSAVGFIVGATLGWHRPMQMPAPDDSGGGPRSNFYTPDPETGTGGGPRSFGGTPDPETGSGGGPRSQWWFPSPDDSGVGPRS